MRRNRRSTVSTHRRSYKDLAMVIPPTPQPPVVHGLAAINTYSLFWRTLLTSGGLVTQAEKDECAWNSSAFNLVCLSTVGTVNNYPQYFSGVPVVAYALVTSQYMNVEDGYVHYASFQDYWTDVAGQSCNDDSHATHLSKDKLYTASSRRFWDDPLPNSNYEPYDAFLWGFHQYASGSFQSSTNMYSVHKTLLNTTGTYLYFGIAHGRFKELNAASFATWASGLTLAWEYWNGSTWSALTVTDGTNGFANAGKITWFPPTDWVSCKINNDVFKNWYVRCHPTAVTTAPITHASNYAYKCLWAERYLTYNGSTGYVAKGWDPANDVDGDGYVSDAEYASLVNPLCTARFAYQGRAPAFSMPQYYGRQWYSNVTNLDVQAWAANEIKGANYISRTTPNLDGVWIDNLADTFSTSAINITTREFATDDAWHQAEAAAVAKVVAVNPGKKILVNFGGFIDTQFKSAPVTPTYDHGAGLIAAGAQLNQESFAVLTNSHEDQIRQIREIWHYCSVHGGNCYLETLRCDGLTAAKSGDTNEDALEQRREIYVLAAYYLVQCKPAYGAGFGTTYFWYGGRGLNSGTGDPSPSIISNYKNCTQRLWDWFPAMEVDLGDPAGPCTSAEVCDTTTGWASAYDTDTFSQTATPIPDSGTGSGVKYRIFSRTYAKALVLVKPRSQGNLQTFVSGTKYQSGHYNYYTTHALGGTYYPLHADGTTGAGITSIDLRNGEGAILMTSPV